MEKLSASCFECTITDDIIDKQSFSCYTESPSFLAYRARLEGTSDTDSGSLISLIEEWVRGGASVILTGVLMKVDPDCSVAISSLSEEECHFQHLILLSLVGPGGCTKRSSIVSS